MPLFLQRSYKKMYKKYISFILIIAATNCYAQQPPAQLPSLIDGGSGQLAQFREKANELIRKNIFVKVESGKKSVYAGEPFLVTYKFYTGLNSQARVGKQPPFNGCSVLELTTSKDPYEEEVNGKKFNVFIVRKVQLTPLQQGRLELGKAFIDNVVEIGYPDGSGSENFTTSISNEPLSVEVKPLPDVNKPKDFSGSVGHFSIEAKVDSNNITVGENAVLHIKIEGFGNMAGIRLPAIEWPGGTEHFEPSDTQHIDQLEYPVQTYAAFDVPFIGTAEGNETIPPVLFSYFDITTSSYKTIKTNPVAVTFTRPASQDAETANIVTEDVSNKKYLWIVGAIALAVALFWLASSKVKQKKIREGSHLQQNLQDDIFTKLTIIKEAKEPSEIFEAMHQLGTMTGEKKFLTDIKAFITMILREKLNLPAATEQELIGKLKADNNEQAAVCENIYVTCDRNLYSPVTDENIHEEIYFELTAVVKKLYESSPKNG